MSTFKSDIAQLRNFFSVVANSKRLDAMGEVKQAATGVRLTAREIEEKYGVKSENDIYVPEKRMKLILNKIMNKLRCVSHLFSDAINKNILTNYV